MTIIVTEDVAECPRCGGPAVKDGDCQRHCNACGLAWERRNEDDELDAEADRQVRGRGWSEHEGRSRPIGKGQTRW